VATLSAVGQNYGSSFGNGNSLGVIPGLNGSNGFGARSMNPMMDLGAQLLQQNEAMMMQMMMMMMSLMGSASQGSSPALGANYGGGSSASSGGAWTAPASSGAGSSPGAGAVDASQFSGGTSAGRSLAAAAQNEANAEHSTGFCFRGVGRALAKIGVHTSGASAYMAADELAKNPKMKEIKVDRADLPKLPAGAVVVWAQGPGHADGHISVALGNGKEASDHIQSQTKDLTGKGDSFRVFMPV
jgi:hypothetical protein